ncbi:membrane protein [Halarchaeum grantii]|uniref:Membrane protein n=1 Tax=Halarchaeum grantii TaxID=1193105 RepID=A0A830F4V2_9EURY|nr:four-carbon acid sugar kinase family protein [Halarchaeum grantii]GGL38948.1 membrane protein [Halarchaeum grantii]
MTERAALVVADDLTGACDTGHGFAARGHETVVCLTPDFETDAAVVVADTDSRYLAPDAAARRVRDVLAGVDAAVVYKKVDSTLRGNLGPEIAAALDAADAEAAAVAPAFPSNGRVTACGVHLVEGDLVADTPAGNDPDGPVTDSSLPGLLRAQGLDDVGHTGVERVARGDVALDGARVTAVDAVHDSHLAAVADAARERDALLVGSGGLAEHVTLDAPTVERQSLRETPTGTAFGVAGSVAPETLAQLDHLPDSAVVSLAAERAVTDPEGAAADAVSTCRDRLAASSVVVLASARTREDVETTLAAARDADVSERAARDRVTDALGRAARAVWDASAPDGLVLTGGAVARAALDALDAGGLALRGEAVAPGVPGSVVRGGRADGTPLVTKAGAFGGDATLADALDYVRRVPGAKR